MTTEERVNAILATTRLRNILVEDDPRVRLVGFVVDQVIAGLGEGLVALLEIQRRAKCKGCGKNDWKPWAFGTGIGYGVVELLSALLRWHAATLPSKPPAASYHGC